MYSNTLFENIEKPVKIIESISNEYPGKGHNSVLQTFKNSENYTHCILIDSGDFFYPSAFKNLSYYVEYNPDILFISFHGFIHNKLIIEFSKCKLYAVSATILLRPLKLMR